VTAYEDALWVVGDVLAGLDPTQPHSTQAAKVLDALTGDLHAELAIEAGGLERVGFVWDTSQGRPQWSGVDGIGHATERPVYRLTKESTDG